MDNAASSTLVRRVVTGASADGKSCAISDATCEPMELPTFSSTEIWKTTESPVDLAHASDQFGQEFVLEPPANGSILRVIEFPPDSRWKGPDDDLYFHETGTIDYIVVTKGEIWCVFDDGEVCLKAGDVLIQRGVNHAWSVRTPDPCQLVAVLINAHHSS